MKTESVSCDLCDSDFNGLWAAKGGLTVRQCLQCGLVYTNPRPAPEELLKEYGAEYFSGGNYENDPQRRKMYHIEIETQIKRLAGSRGRFLDVGCAYGAFLNALPDTFEKYGIEFSREAADFGRKRFGLDIRAGQLNAADYPSDFFDIIHFRGVIEHLQSPRRDLEAARRFLKPSGYLIVSTTPNIDSPAARRYRDMFRLFLPGEHIYYFSPETLSVLLQKAGFEAERVFYPYLNTPYANPVKDIFDFLFNKYRGLASPPFFKSVMTFYAKKT